MLAASIVASVPEELVMVTELDVLVVSRFVVPPPTPPVLSVSHAGVPETIFRTCPLDPPLGTICLPVGIVGLFRIKASVPANAFQSDWTLASALSSMSASLP